MIDSAAPHRDRRLRLAADRAASGRAQIVHVRGAAGIGRSTLLRHLRNVLDAENWNVYLLGGLGPCSDEPFGALRTLVHLFADGAAQRALGEQLEVGGRVDRVVVQVGLLRLIADSAHDQPLALLLDDADRFDPESQQAMTFAIGQLMADAVLVVDAALDRSRSSFDTLAGELVVLEPLSDAEIRASIDELADFDPAVVDVIVDRAAGNPMAARSLALTLDPEQRRGQAPLPFVNRAHETNDVAASRFATLSPDLRRALAVVAADDSGEIPLISDALGRLGEDRSVLDEAVASGFLDVQAGRVRFTDPDTRSIAYQEIAEASRRAAHRALAAAYDRPDHAVRRAWHLAEAAHGHDPDAVMALDLVAAHDRRRGAPLAAARALERAAQLDVDPAAGMVRIVDACGLRVFGGDDEGARRRLDELDVTRAPADIRVAASAVIAATWGPAPETLLQFDAPDATAALHQRAHVAMRAGNRAVVPSAFCDTSLLDRAWSGGDRNDIEMVADDLRRAVTLGVAGRRWQRLTSLVLAAIDIDLGNSPADGDEPDWRTALLDGDARFDGWLVRAAAELAVRCGSEVERQAGGRRLAHLGSWLEDRPTRVPPDEPSRQPRAVIALSPAEMRVARSVTNGRTNRAAAEELFVSRKTVDFHLQQIFRKLGIRTRTELAVLVSQGAVTESPGTGAEYT